MPRVPASHAQSPSEDDPVLLVVVPVGQDVQDATDDEPGDPAYVPTGQSVQLEAPEEALA